METAEVPMPDQAEHVAQLKKAAAHFASFADNPRVSLDTKAKVERDVAWLTDLLVAQITRKVMA